MLNVTTLLRSRSPAEDDLRYGRLRARVGRPVVVWTATRSCNLACRHCYAASLPRRYPGELSTAEANNLVDDLASMPAAGLLVSGGEPLLRDDVLDVAARASRQGLRTTLSTNGTALADPAVADDVSAAGFSYVGVSFDGLGQTHDRFRGEAGAFERSVAGVRNLVARGERVGLRLTLTATTLPVLPDVFDFIVDEGFGRACFYHLAPSGRGRSAPAEALTAQQTRHAVDAVFDFADRMIASRPELEVLTVANAADGPRLLDWLAERGRPTEQVAERLTRAGGNHSGIGLAHVSNTGEVHPDQFSWTDRLGSVRQRPFSRIWADSTGRLGALRARSGLLGGRCGACRHLDVCGGNLRMRAHAATGDHWAEDPACYLTPQETTR